MHFRRYFLRENGLEPNYSQAKVSEAITNVLKISPNDGSASDSNAAETADKNEAS